jgi:hypothetical protein
MHASTSGRTSIDEQIVSLYLTGSRTEFIHLIDQLSMSDSEAGQEFARLVNWAAGRPIELPAPKFTLNPAPRGTK